MVQKQEAGAAGAPDPGEYGEAPETHVCPEGKVWQEGANGEAGKCVAVSVVTPDVGAEVGTSAVTESLMDAITRTIKEANAKMYQTLRAEQKKDIDRLRKELSGEAERALRKSFGLEVDPVVHKSDLANLARQLQLETSKSGKRSPASPGATGPAGNAEANKTPQSKAIEGLFKDFKGGKS